MGIGKLAGQLEIRIYRGGQGRGGMIIISLFIIFLSTEGKLLGQCARCLTPGFSMEWLGSTLVYHISGGETESVKSKQSDEKEWKSDRKNKQT